MATQPKLNVAICGGGIGGLVLAHVLSSPQISVNIYEAAAKFDEAGSGMGVSPRHHTILSALNLGEEFEKAVGAERGGEPMKYELPYVQADSNNLREIYKRVIEGGGFTVRRAEFQDALLRYLPKAVRISNGKRLLSYTQPEDTSTPIQLRFADGSDATCDVLVGADGVKSTVRATMLEHLAKVAEEAGDSSKAQSLRESIPARFSGYTSYRVLAPSEKLAQVAPDHRAFSSATQYLGTNRMIIVYPVSQGKFINLGVTTRDPNRQDELHPEPWSADIDSSEILEMFDGWNVEIQNLFKSAIGTQAKKYVVNVVKPLPTFVDGRVVLLGDAAHAMTPFQGAGAGQAMEDAFILKQVLFHPDTTLANVSRALQVYSNIRKPFAQRVAEASWEAGVLWHGANPSQEAVLKGLEAGSFIDNSDPLVEVHKANKMLNEALQS